MKLTALLFSAFVFSVSIFGFLRTLEEEIKLKHWRKNLAKGMSVIIDNGKVIYKAQIMWIGAGWVRVIGPDGKTAAFGTKCIYPLNYIVNEEHLHTSDCDLPECEKRAV
ncbi:MAG: hypothetical protein Q8R90_05670 [Bacteroidales bacterium]|nr:hypothetical protein [Bacteroidales bacterium]